MDWPAALVRPFRLIAFDWDGTAVRDRREDAAPLRQVLERLLETGVWIAVITGTHVENLERQLLPLRDKSRLWLSTNRGSEGFVYRDGERVLVEKRRATPEEDRLLTEAAMEVREELVARTGKPIGLVMDRLNRRKIDLIPEWPDPPKSEIRPLLAAVEKRLEGLPGGLGEVFRIAERILRGHPLSFRVTSDVKHLEIGLTDKSDAIDWVIERARREGIEPRDILIGGDEFGPLKGFPGSDAMMITPRSREATFVTVGVEPEGVPSPVLFLGGGPSAFLELLAKQAALPCRSGGKEPWVEVSPEPTCTLVEEGTDLVREHEIQTLFTVSNGFVGTLGSLPEGSRMSSPATLVAGMYQCQAVPELAILPDWTTLHLSVENRPVSLEAGESLVHRRILDLRQGLMWREWRHRDEAGRVTSLRFLRLASLADRHLLAQVVWIRPENYTGHLRLASSILDTMDTTLELIPEEEALLLSTTGTEETVAFATLSRLFLPDGVLLPQHERTEGRFVEWWEWKAEISRSYRLDRLVTLYTSQEEAEPVKKARARALELERPGMGRIIEEHQRAWETRWNASRCSVGDPLIDRALCFARYHLISAANPENERVSIGARALTGTSYLGHVFWDTEIYLLPFYLHTWPEAARSLLMYRFHTLPAARDRARTLGYRGALYAWESTITGEDATPPFVLAPDGELLPVFSGAMEHHISADVAFAVWAYWEATRDEEFFREAGAEILLETARFWESRGQWEGDDRFHIRGVIGPDEYHIGVDDNAFTNHLAMVNLERGVETARILRERWPDRWRALSASLGLEAAELERWGGAARGMETGFHPESGLIEQFEGFFELEDLDLSLYAERNVPIDLLLGRERVARSRISKQADVVLLLHLLWERFPPEVREANFRFYEPLCAHGSSLSPPIFAAVAVRLGELALAERFLRQTADIDLANNMGNAAGGVHIGALGGLWQALFYGLVGFEGGDPLRINPLQGPAFPKIEWSFGWRDRRIRLSSEGGGLLMVLEDGAPLRVKVGDRPEEVLAFEAGEAR